MVFTDCESCTRPISTQTGSMESGEYGVTRGTCFVLRCLKVVTVAKLLLISRCVLGAAAFRDCFFGTHMAYCKYEAALPHLPLFWNLLLIHRASPLYVAPYGLHCYTV